MKPQEFVHEVNNAQEEGGSPQTTLQKHIERAPLISQQQSQENIFTKHELKRRNCFFSADLDLNACSNKVYIGV